MTAKLWAGPKWMLLHAIEKHRREKMGVRPKRFELHPEVLYALRNELEPELIYDVFCRADGAISFNGVEIVEDVQATMPKMITSDNVVEYL